MITDVYRGIRQFERAVGVDTNEPRPDQRGTESSNYQCKRNLSESSGIVEGDRIIATVTYNLGNQTMKTVRYDQLE